MLEKEKTALIVIDVQGNLAQSMDGRESLFANISRLIRGFTALSMPIIWTEQVPDKLGRTIPELASLLEGYPLVSKATFSCMGEPEYQNTLKALGRRKFVVCGIEAHVCVYQTVRDMLAGGYEVEIAVDSISSRNGENKRIAIEKMRDMGAKLTSAEMALFELTRTAEAPEFREIQKIVK